MLLERALGHADKESDCSVSIDLEREAQTLFECEFLPAFQRPSRPKTLSIPSVRSQGLRLAQSAAVVVANRYRTHHCCQPESTRVDREQPLIAAREFSWLLSGSAVQKTRPEWTAETRGLNKVGQRRLQLHHQKPAFFCLVS